MKKIRTYSILSLALCVILLSPAYSMAQGKNSTPSKAPEFVDVPTKNQNRNQNATATANINKSTTTHTQATSTPATNKSQGDEHKSAVAQVVAKLLLVADREGGIGSEVRMIAQEQASTSDKVKKDMDEIANENPLKRFFFGTNYKNTGELRSTVVTTKNHIDRLKKALEKTTSTTTKAELTAQINELEKVASSTEAFIKTNENKFSLLGWLSRFLSQ